jgi:hypothetical protein
MLPFDRRRGGRLGGHVEHDVRGRDGRTTSAEECLHGPRPDLVGLAEIAERLAMNPWHVEQWSRRSTTFPAPVAQLRIGSVWCWSDVVGWLRTCDHATGASPRSEPVRRATFDA